jgi:hypothetical protein
VIVQVGQYFLVSQNANRNPAAALGIETHELPEDLSLGI